MLFRLIYLGVSNAFVLLRLLMVSDRDKAVEILALRHQIAVVGADNVVTAVDLVFPAGLRRVKFGIWLRESLAIRHCQYLCRNDSLIWWCSVYSAGLPCWPVLTVPGTPGS
jgi:putative transposase